MEFDTIKRRSSRIRKRSGTEMRKIGVVVALTLPSTSLIQHVHSHVVNSDERMVDTMDDDNDTHYLRRNTPTRYPLHIIEDSNNARWSTGSSLIHEEEANTIAVNIPQSQVSHDNNGVTEDQIHKIQNKERRQKQTNARRENPYQSTEKWWTDYYHGNNVGRGRCVQSCEVTTTSNPHCGGIAPNNIHLFDTPQYCCQVMLNWLSIEECMSIDDDETDLVTGEVETKGGGEMTALTSSSMNNSQVEAPVESFENEIAVSNKNGCPPEYVYTDMTYQPGDHVTIYLDSPINMNGQIYKCKDDVHLAQMCDIFPPGWRREAPGGGSVHSDGGLLGWEMDELCTNEIQEMYATNIEKPQVPNSNKPPLKPKPTSGGGCWRSGKPCASHADEFACCGVCSAGFCVDNDS